ncbi:MAG: hypothetical protein ACR2P5_06745 [Gammaproteobacteria bacterium]
MKFEGITVLLGDILRVSPDTITISVLGCCLALFAVSCIFGRLRHIAPGLMISAGIIGTFWGTFLALSNFLFDAAENGVTDYNAIVNNIPKVLEGMTTAFITSLIGLFFYFVSKLIFSFFPKTQPKPLKIETDVVDLLGKIREGIVGENDKSLSSQLGVLQAEYRDSVQDLKQSISGESDTSVSSQLIKLRNENSAGFKALDARLDGLADVIRNSLVDSLQKLVKELREVIVEQLAEQLKRTNELLHTQLSEMLDRIEEALIKQFGETFKQFNEATQAIKKWQEDHREQVEQLTTAFQATAAGIEKIRADCESIPATMEALQKLMGELDERLKAFADMKKEAEQFFPTVKENMDAVGADLRKSAEGFSGLEKTITDTYTQAGNLAQQHIETARQHIETVGEQINQTARQVAAASENMMTESRQASDRHREEIRRIADEVQSACRNTVESAQGAITGLSENMKQRITEIAEGIAEASENMIAETRNASNQHQSEIRQIVNAVQEASQRCVQDTQEQLTAMAKVHADSTNSTMTGIAKRWGENMIGIADEVARRIPPSSGGNRV